jgi:hypothetical protein
MASVITEREMAGFLHEGKLEFFEYKEAVLRGGLFLSSNILISEFHTAA